MWFKNLKIGSKLLLSLMTTLVIAVGVGVFTIITMHDIEENYTAFLEATQLRLKYVVEQQEYFAKTRILLNEIFYVDNTEDDLKRLRRELEKGREDFTRSLEMFTEVAIPAAQAEAREIFPTAERYYAEALNAVDMLLASQIISLESREYRDALSQAQVHVDYIAASYAADMTRRTEDLLTMTLTEMKTTSDNSRNVNDQKVLLTVAMLACMAVVVLIITFYVSGLIRKPLEALVAAAENVAKGNLNINADASTRDEIGKLAGSFNSVIGVIQKLITGMQSLAKKINADGDIDGKLDVNEFEGSYRDVAVSINGLVSDIINDTMLFLGCLTEFGGGNMKADIHKLPGKKIVMNQTLDKFRDIVQSINNDAISLVHEAAAGNLAKRVNVSAYSGDWASLAKELNSLMDTLSAPIKEVSEVLKYVSDGRFDKKMTGDYRGEFLKLKDSVNTTVTNIS
ncbi:MAG: HAMP domain-containing protein, partial [Defluviitaleaceae bacterium]|nr:HAMP domain-containing protein [Defluviitaleaceae bacterium]